MKERFRLIKVTNRKLGILLDTIKSIIIILLTLVLIVFFGSSIIHNILRVGEVSSKYKGEYKQLYSVSEKKMMNIYQKGEGERTIVILPSFGEPSPVIRYKALIDTLSSRYKVVIAEPLGYGYSLSTDEDRTSENIIKELREGLAEAEIQGPFVLLAFSNSSLYANYYSQEYPEEIIGIISINGMYAESINNKNFKSDYLPNLISNIKFYSIVSFSGIFRWESYIKPESFDIDKMENNDSYGKEELKIYRNLIANKFLTKPMKKEIEKLKDNMKDQLDFKYSENLQTLQILTKDYVDEYSAREENIAKYAKNLITNEETQLLMTIDGKLSDYLFDKDMLKQLKQIITMYF